MEQTIENLCLHVKNWFIHSTERGTFTITDGIINTKGHYLADQYVLIKGSILHDGIYTVKDTLMTLDGATNETFTGSVSGLAIPQGLIAIAKDVEEFERKAGVANGLFSSESFGNYSYTIGKDSDGNSITWQSAFGRRLVPYQRTIVLQDP